MRQTMRAMTILLCPCGRCAFPPLEEVWLPLWLSLVGRSPLAFAGRLGQERHSLLLASGCRQVVAGSALADSGGYPGPICHCARSRIASCCVSRWSDPDHRSCPLATIGVGASGGCHCASRYSSLRSSCSPIGCSTVGARHRHSRLGEPGEGRPATLRASPARRSGALRPGQDGLLARLAGGGQDRWAGSPMPRSSSMGRISWLTCPYRCEGQGEWSSGPIRRGSTTDFLPLPSLHAGGRGQDHGSVLVNASHTRRLLYVFGCC